MLENILSAGREYFRNPHVYDSAKFPDVPVVDCFWGNVCKRSASEMHCKWNC